MALNVLNLLYSSGKIVGVIYHVEALKERIPLQIKVEPLYDGTGFLKLGYKSEDSYTVGLCWVYVCLHISLYFRIK
jgi:hypothetical protein